MHIRLVTPVPPRSRRGNRVTALTWRRVFQRLGHRVTVAEDYAGEPCDLLLALHAKRSHGAIVRYRAGRPSAPLIVVLTGTDLYGDLPDDPAAQESLRLADRLVVLQDHALQALPPAHRDKTHIIVQSARGRPAGPPTRNRFYVSVIGHLRPVKDPFLAARAARLLPQDSSVTVLHAGGALEPAMAQEARQEMAENPRYRWLGELPRWRAQRVLARSRLMVLSSRAEGGANVIGEAAVLGRPILATEIPGTTGLLGDDYGGYFPVGAAEALAGLLLRCESEPDFLAGLTRQVRDLAPRFAPRAEEQAWATLLDALAQ